jgi:hypothetical protein
MADELGYAPNRAHLSRAGNFHLNGGKLYDSNEVDQSAALAGMVSGIAAGYRIARGQFTTVTAADTVATGLNTVVAVIAQMESDLAVGVESITSQVGDQVGTPVAGSIILKSWKTLGGTPAAATTFGQKVNWLAIGT